MIINIRGEIFEPVVNEKNKVVYTPSNSFTDITDKQESLCIECGSVYRTDYKHSNGVNYFKLFMLGQYMGC